MKFYAAVCVYREPDRWIAEIEIIGETREKVEREVEAMLNRCMVMDEEVGETRYEKLENSEYDYVFYERAEESDEEEVLYRYRILEMSDGEPDGAKERSIANEILDLSNIYERTSKETITKNVVAMLCKKHPECMCPKERNKRLMCYTGVGKHSVQAWLNKSRSDAKIPFLKLCMIADGLKVNVRDLIEFE